MGRPLLVDLCCGAGGAAWGYHLAGFDVVGVDIAPQPRYPFRFVQADALTFPLDGFAAAHASPVCKRWSKVTRSGAGAGRDHPDQIAPLRSRLAAAGIPYVIENVPEAPLIAPRILCGSMFDLDIRRHRGFETNWGLPDHPWPCRHRIWARRYPSNRSRRTTLAYVVDVSGHGNAGQPVELWRRVMGVEWMTRDELAQAIPPAYTEWIGGRLLAYLADGAVA